MAIKNHHASIFDFFDQGLVCAPRDSKNLYTEMTPNQVSRVINKYCYDNKLSYPGCARISLSRPDVVIVYTPAHHAEKIEDFVRNNRFEDFISITFREFPSWVHEGYKKNLSYSVVHLWGVISKTLWLLKCKIVLL